jgi:hypothetical protein
MKKMDMSLKMVDPVKGAGVFIPDDLRREAIKARDFLASHPALGGADKEEPLYYSIQEVCKRGINELGPVSVWNTPHNRKKFEKDFNKKFSQEELAKNKYCYLYKNYKQVYGEKWQFDHIEYWWETSFYVFQGSIERDNNDWMDYKNWQSYSHGEDGTLTIEEAYIAAAKFAKETLGDFKYDSFITEAEKENHKKNNPFNFKKSDMLIAGFNGKEEACRTMEHNKKYLWVSNGMENRRWLKWFVDTPFCKKNWKKEFNGLVKIQPPNE